MGRKARNRINQTKRKLVVQVPGMSALLWRIGVRDNWLCWICAELVMPTSTDPLRYATKDHLIPLSLGGPVAAQWNLRISHFDCNAKRDDFAPPPRQELLKYVDSRSYNSLLERFRNAYGYEFSAHQG